LHDASSRSRDISMKMRMVLGRLLLENPTLRAVE
jgi:hypothetical protein